MIVFAALQLVLHSAFTHVQSVDAGQANLCPGVETDSRSVGGRGEALCEDVEIDNYGQMLLQVAMANSLGEQQNEDTAGGYYWSQRGGDSSISSSTPHTAPSNFSSGPTWAWENELDEQVRHSPLIDDKMNIYVMTTTRVRKFSPDGQLLWTWQNKEDHPKMTTAPVLYKGQIFLLSGSKSGTMHILSLDMASGNLSWKSSFSGMYNGDSQGLAILNDTIIVPMHKKANTVQSIVAQIVPETPTNTFAAVNSSDGSPLWEYVADEWIWNAVPAVPGDGTLLFSGSCGGAFRINFGGQLIWRVGPPPEHVLPGFPDVCSTGGGSVGPNGVFYTEYRRSNVMYVSAFQVSDGALLWNKSFTGYGKGGQYPAVGRLGSDGPLAVVVALGENPGIPKAMSDDVFQAYLKDPEVRQQMGVHSMRNAVVAMDATDGNILWSWEEQVWDRFGAAGDEEGFQQRRAKNDIEGAICLPDMQGIPLIAGDGTVYASSGHSGELTAIKDVDGNGMIDPSEVSSFAAHNCFLNSPSLAPGMLVAAPCWGPMYVFKS